jgi:hypothetical protein
MKASVSNIAHGDFRQSRTAVGTHSHLVRNIDAGDEVALANLIAWARATGVGAVGLGSPWTHLSGLAYRRCEGPDRDRYFAGLLDREPLLFRDDIAAMLKRANDAAEGKTFFYLDNETPKNRYGHLWYVGFDYQVPAWHDYSQDHRVQFCDTDPVEDPNPLAQGGAHRRRTYMEVVARQRKAGALAVWAHPTSWWTNPDGSFVTNIAADLVPELLADGFLDGMTVQGYDAYHRDYQALWFHLLDKGYRIPGFSELDLSPANGTGGKGHALFNYIEGLDRPPTMNEMKDAFRNALHTMSSGPYLTIRVDGRPSGSSLVSGTGTLHRVSVTAFPAPDEAALAKVELIGRNGKILAAVDDFPGGAIDFDVAGDVTGGYILARAFGEKDGDYAAMPQQRVRHCAITNPVWLRTPGFAPPPPVVTRVTLLPGDAAGARLRILAANGDELEAATLPAEPTTLTIPASARIEVSRSDGRLREIPVAMANGKVRGLMDYLADGRFREDYAGLAPGEVPTSAFKCDAMRGAISQTQVLC